MQFSKLKDLGVEVVHFNVTDSTNLRAKEVALKGYTSPVLFVTDSQTAGKGRMGRSFYSPDGTGLYMSYLYKVTGNFADNVTVTSAAAVAVVRAIEELTDLEPKIKWVNDIYVDSKKVCGILTEAVTDKNGITSVIVGIGLNINTTDFPHELTCIAGSLGKTMSREILAQTIVKHLQILISQLSDRTFIEDYIKHSAVLGKEVVYIIHGVEHTATAVGIDNNGGLIVEHKDGGKTTLFTGEISVKLI